MKISNNERTILFYMCGGALGILLVGLTLKNE